MLLACFLGGCGAHASLAPQLGHDDVVRVGHQSITKAMLAHWTAVEAVLTFSDDLERPPPSGLVPDPPAYKNCIRYMSKTSPNAPYLTVADLKSQCEGKYYSVRTHILEILISYAWMHEEAAALHVSVSLQAIEDTIRLEHATKAGLRRLLAATGESEADERYVIEGKLLVGELEGVVSSKSGLTSQQRAEISGSYPSVVTARWKKRTNCRTGYVEVDCMQYHP